jgi:hypothetical protein
LPSLDSHSFDAAADGFAGVLPPASTACDAAELRCQLAATLDERADR